MSIKLLTLNCEKKSQEQYLIKTFREASVNRTEEIVIKLYQPGRKTDGKSEVIKVQYWHFMLECDCFLESTMVWLHVTSISW